MEMVMGFLGLEIRVNAFVYGGGPFPLPAMNPLAPAVLVLGLALVPIRPPPPLGGESTFWVLKACNGRISLKIFLVKQWGKYFWWNFGRTAEISAAQPQMKFQKFQKRRVKIPKICIFFTKMGLKVSHHASKNKKNCESCI